MSRDAWEAAKLAFNLRTPGQEREAWTLALQTGQIGKNKSLLKKRIQWNLPMIPTHTLDIVVRRFRTAVEEASRPQIPRSLQC